MAGYGTNTIHRPSTTSASVPATSQTEESKYSTRRNSNDFKLIFPFNIPPTAEAAAVRIIRNLSYFGFYYIIFVWVILFIVLLPRRKLSLIFLVGMTIVTCLYLLLLRFLADSVVLLQIIDKRLVFAFLFIVTMVEMILTRAAVHFFVTLGSATPVILVQAVLRVRDNLFVNEEASAAGELVPLVHKRTADIDVDVHGSDAV